MESGHEMGREMGSGNGCEKPPKLRVGKAVGPIGTDDVEGLGLAGICIQIPRFFSGGTEENVFHQMEAFAGHVEIDEVMAEEMGQPDGVLTAVGRGQKETGPIEIE